MASSIGGSVLLPANGTQFTTGKQVFAANQWLSSAHQAVQQFSVDGCVNYLDEL